MRNKSRLSLLLTGTFFLAFFVLGRSTELFSGIFSKDESSRGALLPSSIPLADRFSQNPYIKILLLENGDRFTLSISSSYVVSFGKQTVFGQSLPSSSVTVTSGGIQLGGRLFPDTYVKIDTQNRDFHFNQRIYHDNLLISKTVNGRMNVMNEVQLEDYLKGVLPWEVSDKWPLETLKVQAVASRTYALFKMLERAGRSHILTSDVLSQVYVGKSAEKIMTNQAVDLTRGEVLVFQNNIFPAFFHSTCGGQTTEAHRVWRIQPNPVLSGVTCLYCKGNKHQRWRTTVPLEEIRSRIASRGFTISPIKSIIFADFDPSSRAQKVVIDHAKGQLKLDANDFRLFVGADVIRSTRVSVKISGGKAYFSGLGWGHGVGMCQWGAKAQAELGRNYREILTFYYPGSSIKKLYGTEKVLNAEPSAPQESEKVGFAEKVERTLNDWFG